MKYLVNMFQPGPLTCKLKEIWVVYLLDNPDSVPCTSANKGNI